MMYHMADDAVDKFLAEQKSIEDKRQALIKDLLREKETVIKVFDDKLAKLGYEPDHAPKHRSHHTKPDEKKPAQPPK